MNTQDKTTTEVKVSPTPRPWATMRGRRGFLNTPENELKPFVGVQTNLVKNGPEAAICEMVLSGPTYGPIDHKFHSISPAEADANAAEIVKCVNAYPKLVEALKSIHAAFVFHGTQSAADTEEPFESSDFYPWIPGKTAKPLAENVNTLLRELGELQ